MRSGSIPRRVAALHNTVLGPLHQRRWRNIAAALRHYTKDLTTDVLHPLGFLPYLMIERPCSACYAGTTFMVVSKVAGASIAWTEEASAAYF